MIMTLRKLLPFLLGVAVMSVFAGCISSKETVYRETERVKIEFENDAAARIFYEAYSKQRPPQQRNEKTTSFEIPVILSVKRTETDSGNALFNDAVRHTDTNGDGKITEQEARIYAEQVERRK